MIRVLQIGGDGALVFPGGDVTKIDAGTMPERGERFDLCVFIGRSMTAGLSPTDDVGLSCRLLKLKPIANQFCTEVRAHGEMLTRYDLSAISWEYLTEIFGAEWRTGCDTTSADGVGPGSDSASAHSDGQRSDGGDVGADGSNDQSCLPED